MARLNLGVGSRPDHAPDVINVDRNPLPGVQVVHDLDVHPWPFDAGAFDDVRALHVYEHVADPIGFMAECHRVMVAGARLLIIVPHYQSENAFTDPTHVRFCTTRTWDYWVPGTQLHAESEYAGGATFAKDAVYREGDDVVAILRKA